MDPEVKLCRSLPPLVEGKIHGYLNLTIDEIIWSRKSPGDVTVLASWWGELDSAQFRPIDIKTGALRLKEDITETYVIRTNVSLFEAYLHNCETIELVVISEKTHEVIGTAHIVDLLDLFESKLYSRYFPILNSSGNRLGDIHVDIGLSNMTRSMTLSSKLQDSQKRRIISQLPSSTTNFDLRNEGNDVTDQRKNLIKYKEGGPMAIKNAKHNENICKSILKSKEITFDDPVKKFNMEVTDKLVAQVVARAQRLRGAILRETYGEDPLALSENSTLESSVSDASLENKTKLYEYFADKRSSCRNEDKALEALKSTSPSSSMIDLTSRSVQSHRHNGEHTLKESNNLIASQSEILSRESVNVEPEEPSPLDYVDSLRIIVESLTLSSAGYRRVRSSCLSRGDHITRSVTYFVQYDTTFAPVKKLHKKLEAECRPTKLCSKKQIGQVVYFNHQSVHDISKSYIQRDTPLTFKIYSRHLNQRIPSELGVGSMYIGDVTETDHLSITQKLAVINKGMKTGELKVTVELGCDHIHFGKHFVDAVTSTKENIPVYEIPAVSTGTSRFKRATGTESKGSSRVSSASAKRMEYTSNAENSGAIDRRNLADPRKRHAEDETLRIEIVDNIYKDKVLLHALIYIAEGKDLPQSNTYLICRAFWQEDRAVSQLCSNTENPFYHFHQLVPLLHGPDLLERTKDNCIMIEVYCRNSLGVDSLLGITKLPVHQLYVAYRDPLVLPHLLLSKYPVISVDGWVPIADPITGQSRGQLLALVALGTADQIALLEMTRGLRDFNVTPHTVRGNAHAIPEREHYSQSTKETVNSARQNGCYTAQQNPTPFPYPLQATVADNKMSHVQGKKTQESQTDMMTLIEDNKSSNSSDQPAQNENLNSQNFVLHALVDRLAQALNVPKPHASQTAETQTVHSDNVEKPEAVERLCLERSSDNCSSDNSSSGSPRETFHLPSGLYRSVGVGAEFDDAVNPPPSTSYNVNVYNSLTEPQPSAHDQLNADMSNDDDTSFRAVVEIECALHLPKVEKPDGPVEPSTYVTFHDIQNRSDEQFRPYTVTNISLSSCNPKWDWRCQTRLPTELLLNDERRLILKVWRLADPNISTTIDLEKDIVIGFSAIDLSVLSAGFPLVSGWFHIMDFTGKCNGQIKVSITPLDNISSYGKSTSATSLTKSPIPNFALGNCSSEIPRNTLENYAPLKNAGADRRSNEVTTNESQTDNNATPEVGLSFGDTSMSFLSLSLKQKLTELDEITKRLQSRLHDVTNAAFDEDFDNDFDPNEQDAEIECNENGNIGSVSPMNAATRGIKPWQPLSSRSNNSTDDETIPNGNQITLHGSGDSNGSSLQPNLTDRGYSTASNIRSNENLSIGRRETQRTHENRPVNEISNATRQPVRGTKTHISHLLDKLSSQLSTAAPPSGKFTMKRNIFDLITDLRHNNNNNNLQSDGKCYREVGVRTVPTQTDSENIENIQAAVQHRELTSADIGSHNATNAPQNNDACDTFASDKTQRRDKVSALIREELVAEENNDTSPCDDLTTHLITSNVRHMDLDNIFNPLLYQHLMPDMQFEKSTSIACGIAAESATNLNAVPEGDAVEQLDNRYTETFNATINNGLSRLRSLVEIDASTTGEADSGSQNRGQRSPLEARESAEVFRLTPSGLSESADGNIDVTVIHRPSNNDLMASNGTDSTTTISLEKSSNRQSLLEMDDTSSLMSTVSSVSAASRQAPDGGNPVEEPLKPSIVNSQDDAQDSS